MKRSSIFLCTALAASLAANAAFAQVIPPGGSLFSPPPPPAPPPPRIEAPVVPKMDVPLQQSYQPPSRPLFSDRINRCLDDAAAAGLGPNDRVAYSRSCANQ
jgi:hypothetical protein